MCGGNSAINYLVKKINEEDPAESSHWQYFNRKVKYENNTLLGVKGFGKIGKRLFGISNLVHYLFQKPFRDEGKKFKDFYDIDKIARNVAQKQQRSYDSDCLRHTLILSYLREKLEQNLKKKPTTCIIGDGFAFMSSLLINMNFTKKLYLVNLTKVLIADLLYLKIWMGDKIFNSTVNLVTNVDELISIDKNNKVTNKLQIIAIQAKDFELLKFCDYNFVINIHSMQEMNLEIVKKYFYFMKSSKSKEKILFYCCNREEKKLFDGSVSRFKEYPWDNKDEIIFDELCPIWNQRTYSFKPPFYINFDGMIRHRLLFLSKFN